MCPRTPKPKVKIREIILKEARKNYKNEKGTNAQSGFVDNNREIVIQLCNMRNYVDFYNEVLANRFSTDNFEKIEETEQALIYEKLNEEEQLMTVRSVVKDSRPFYKRLFKKSNIQRTYNDGIILTRRMTIQNS